MEEKLGESLIPKSKYCWGCTYFDSMLYYNCQPYKEHIATDGETRYLKCPKCLALMRLGV